MTGRRQDSVSRTLPKPLRQTAKAHAAEITVRQMDESLSRGENDAGGKKKKKKQPAHLLPSPDTPGISSICTPQEDQREGTITIRFEREPLNKEDTQIADIVRVRLGLDKHLAMLKENCPDKVDEIRKYSMRWLEVNELYMRLVESRSGLFSNTGKAMEEGAVAAESAEDDIVDLGVYEGSSTGVPKHFQPQKRTRRIKAVDDSENESANHSKRPRTLDEPLDYEIAEALRQAEASGAFDEV